MILYVAKNEAYWWHERCNLRHLNKKGRKFHFIEIEVESHDLLSNIFGRKIGEYNIEIL